MAEAYGKTFESEKKRSENWSEEEISVLIEIWREKIDDLRRAKRNKSVYEAMAAEIRLRRPTSRAGTWSERRSNEDWAFGRQPIYLAIFPENDENSNELIDVPVPERLESEIRVTRSSKKNKRPLERQINELISEIKRSNAGSEKLERKSIKIAEEGLQLQRESIELQKELLSVIKMSN
ncbi:myb/SANT-like DNA-binding domain-containing protein 1 [Centruroides sculpturatus]|uniref:myb/SANT-like DNA-binding domain-containing protein 1 n=1 Tax=Centruroides sculpturatus TaxID=218467 RepID=UPI000C6EF404|nr:myb/SANT-like DNA-binding domain-containing protein 1 [Centruroides sculpturatus]